MMRSVVLCLLLLTVASTAYGADSLLANLKREHVAIQASIAEARAKENELSGGLLKSLISSRLEVLMINEALLQQRIHVIKAGSPVTISTATNEPDPTRAAELAKEIEALEQRIVTQEAEESKYGGGLIKAMAATTVATSRISLEMLRLEHLKAKYGIAWVPAIKGPVDPPQPDIAKWSRPITDTGSAGRSELPLRPTVANKRFQESNFRDGLYQDLLMFDVEWDASQLKQATRAIKGVLVFSDIFGEPRFRIRVTIDDPITAGSKFSQTGIGFEYNRFSDEHQWVRSTELHNMTIQFEPHEVLYADGSRKKF